MLHYILIFQFLALSVLLQFCDGVYTKATKRALQKSHEKPRVEKLSGFFLEKDFFFYDPDRSLINLLNEVANVYLSECTTAILYDNYTWTQDRVFLTKFFQHYPLTHVHGTIPDDYDMQIKDQRDQKCVHYIVFIKDVMRCQAIISGRNEKVVVVTKSSQWRVQEYLSSEYSQEIANLLVIVKSNSFLQQNRETYILYTHKLFVDALGSSQPVVLTSWLGVNFTRNVNLFQRKLSRGFAGHRFIIAIAHQPPYVIKVRLTERDEVEYGGIEVKLVQMLSQMYNFSTDYKESPEVKTLGSSEAVIKALKSENLNLGIGGLYITENRFDAGIFHWHSEDCAAFISLASTALPRYRAIMGPFRWTVWLALIIVYMGAIFLFSYSDKSTLKHLIKNPEEIENMFWYIFGTFTNCFTFTGTKSWTKAEKGTTKLLVGIYWVFTIIITACYTGSIIAFVTLPVSPEVIDTIDQLLEGRYQIGMLDKGGWNYWFHNISDEASRKLMKKVDYVENIESGLKNVTKAFFWSYAFLGSREELTYVVKTNFSVGSRKSLLHITSQCFVPFKVGIILPSHSVYREIFLQGIQRIFQSGLLLKIKSDVEWDMLRTATGRLLAANSKTGSLKSVSDDRALTLDDTQGMFLLLAIGYIAGGGVLLSEIFGGCFNLCKKSEKSKTTSSNNSILSNPRFHENQTNRKRHQSISVTQHQQERSFSLLSNEKESLNQNTEEAFGENLIHFDLNQVTPCNTSLKSMSIQSHVDYNEEIDKIFNSAIEYEDCISTDDEDRNENRHTEN